MYNYHRIAGAQPSYLAYVVILLQTRDNLYFMDIAVWAKPTGLIFCLLCYGRFLLCASQNVLLEALHEQNLAISIGQSLVLGGAIT